MTLKPATNIFWFRRDLRVEDNAGLYHALRSKLPVLCIFIFDKDILDKLEDKDDARVTFIHQALTDLKNKLEEFNASILIKYDAPINAWKELIGEYKINHVFTNNDYEPYARKRDVEVSSMLNNHGIKFTSHKDQIVFEKDEVVKDDGKPYTVFTPYKRKWLEKLNPDFHFKPYPVLKYSANFLKTHVLPIPSLHQIGFTKSTITLPDLNYQSVLADYANTRDYPAIEGTTRIGIHLRFGTISIRSLALEAHLNSAVWLSELIWRDFYSMILWHFPETVNHAFKKEFDSINWRNDEAEFSAWCQGKTGYPIVDAGMRQLNETGWMHNRVRMITASFLCKHLLIDWKWGEAYFASKLLDYDQASNVGGWQWAAGTGNDAAPYFRVFSPDLQMQKFDSKLEYIKKWIPEFGDPFKYAKPIVEHKFARERALRVLKAAKLERNEF